jgi:hypothetical protein
MAMLPCSRSPDDDRRDRPVTFVRLEPCLAGLTRFAMGGILVIPRHSNGSFLSMNPHILLRALLPPIRTAMTTPTEVTSAITRAIAATSG